MVTTITIPCPDKAIKARKSYSMTFKRDALNAINELVLHGDSVRTTCDKVGIPHWYYKCWRMTVFQVDQLLSTKAWVPFNIKGDSCKIHHIQKVNSMQLRMI